jgi:hypothetical protein
MSNLQIPPTTAKQLNTKIIDWNVWGRIQKPGVISDLKEDSNKQTNKVRKSIQGLIKKVSNMEEKFSKETEIMNHNQVQKLEMKTSVNQI